MESLGLAGGTSVLSTNTTAPALEGEQDRNLEREETDQGMYRCDCKHEESNAVRDKVGMDMMQEQTGETSNSTSWCLCSQLLLVLELLCFLSGAQAENCHVFFTESQNPDGLFLKYNKQLCFLHINTAQIGLLKNLH